MIERGGLEARVVAVGSPPAFRQQVARALGAEADSVDWIASVTGADASLIEARDGGRAPDLFVLSPAVKDHDARTFAATCARVAPATAVVLVRDAVAPDALAAAVRAGVRDVVDLSRGGDELRDALGRALDWTVSLRTVEPAEPAPRRAHNGATIAVFSSKGGTGKSFLATSLSVALAQATYEDVALVDMDLEMGDAFSYFGKTPKRSGADIVAIGDLHERETILSLGVSLGERLWGYAAVSEPGADPVPSSAMSQVLRALRGVFTYVVVDLPASYADHVVASLETADVICLVTGLDVVGLRHLSLTMDTLRALDLPADRFRVVLNRADSKVGLSVDEVSRIMNVSVDAAIPSSRLVPTCLNTGRPIVVAEPKSEVAQAIESLAGDLAAAFPPAPAVDVPGLVLQPAAARRRRLLGMLSRT